MVLFMWWFSDVVSDDDAEPTLGSSDCGDNDSTNFKDIANDEIEGKHQFISCVPAPILSMVFK